MRVLLFAVLLAAACGGEAESDLDKIQECFPFGCPAPPAVSPPKGLLALRVLSVDPGHVLSSFVYSNLSEGEPRDDTPEHVVTDPLLDVAYVWSRENQAVLEVDVETGDRKILSGPTRGAGPELKDVRAMAIDSRQRRLFVTDGDWAAVLSVDLLSGDRRIVSEQGPPFSRVTPITYDATRCRVYVAASETPGALIDLDPESGEHVLLLGEEHEGGPGAGTEAMPVAFAMVMHPTEGSVLVVAKAGADRRVLLEIDPDDPNPELWTDGRSGEGPDASRMTGLAVHGAGWLLTVSSPSLVGIDLLTKKRFGLGNVSHYFWGGESVAYAEGADLILVAND